MIFIDNKYTKWYFGIINNAKIRSINSTKTEKHHIIPRSLGGSNAKANLAKVTLREHYICHLLLTKMVVRNSPDWQKMVLALKLMSQTRPSIKVNSRIFEHVRQLTSIVSSTMVRTPESNKKRSDTLRGRESPTKGLKWSEQSKKKLSESKKGKSLANSTKEKLKAANIGKTHSDETKELLREKSKQHWAKRKLAGWTPTEKQKRHRTEQEKAHLREVNLGKKMSEDTKEKIRNSLRATLLRKKNNQS